MDVLGLRRRSFTPSHLPPSSAGCSRPSTRYSGRVETRRGRRTHDEFDRAADPGRHGAVRGRECAGAGELFRLDVHDLQGRPDDAEESRQQPRERPAEPNCKGDNVSPQLSWVNPPAGTKSFAFLMFDPEGRGGGGVIHWVAYGIPATVTGFAEARSARPRQIRRRQEPAGRRPLLRPVHAAQLKAASLHVRADCDRSGAECTAARPDQGGAHRQDRCRRAPSATTRARPDWSVCSRIPGIERRRARPHWHACVREMCRSLGAIALATALLPERSCAQPTTSLEISRVTADSGCGRIRARNGTQQAARSATAGAAYARISGDLRGQPRRRCAPATGRPAAALPPGRHAAHDDRL